MKHRGLVINKATHSEREIVLHYLQNHNKSTCHKWHINITVPFSLKKNVSVLKEHSHRDLAFYIYKKT